MWLSLLRLLLQLASAVATHLRERRLLAAGEAEAVAASIREATHAVERAHRARDAVRPDDELHDDPANRDNW